MSTIKTRKLSISTAMLILDKTGLPFGFSEVLELSIVIDGYLNDGIANTSLASWLIRNAETNKNKQ